jgi:hypothetical protein
LVSGELSTTSEATVSMAKLIFPVSAAVRHC